MNCQCVSNCGCGQTPISSNLICRDTRVAYIKAFNDDGCEVALTGNGLLLSSANSAFYTDGSLDKGQIPFKPNNQGGVKSIVAVSGGDTLVGIGEDADEGSTLVYIGGYWIVQGLGEFKNSFQSATMKSGNKLAAITCSSSGVVELSYLTVTPGTYIYINESGNYEPVTQTQLTENLVASLCPAVKVKTALQEIVSFFGCTAEGIVVKGVPEVPAQMVLLDAPQLINTAVGGATTNSTYALTGKTTAWLHARCKANKVDDFNTGYASAAVNVNGFNYAFAEAAQNGGVDSYDSCTFPVKVINGIITYSLVTVETVPAVNDTSASLYLIGSL